MSHITLQVMMKLSNKEIDINNKDFQCGVRYCIEELRKLNDGFFHVKKWSHSRDLKFAPVELSDYLLLKIKELRDE